MESLNVIMMIMRITMRMMMKMMILRHVPIHGRVHCLALCHLSIRFRGEIWSGLVSLQTFDKYHFHRVRNHSASEWPMQHSASMWTWTRWAGQDQVRFPNPLAEQVRRGTWQNKICRTHLPENNLGLKITTYKTRWMDVELQIAWSSPIFNCLLSMMRLLNNIFDHQNVFQKKLCFPYLPSRLPLTSQTLVQCLEQQSASLDPLPLTLVADSLWTVSNRFLSLTWISFLFGFGRIVESVKKVFLGFVHLQVNCEASLLLQAITEQLPSLLCDDDLYRNITLMPPLHPTPISSV